MLFTRSSVRVVKLLCYDICNVLFLYLDEERKDKQKVVRIQTRHRYIHEGFVYHTKVLAGSTRYLGCAEIKKNGCRARAILPINASVNMIKLTKQHNHPPDHNAQEKHNFIKHLKDASKSMPTTLKKVYDTVKILYPNAAEEISFKSVCSSLHRWRRNTE